ncbi:unnamed protein product, partial [Scytosiphon promiscuus]
MSDVGRLLPVAPEDQDLLCVEVSALGQAPMPGALPRVSCDRWQQQEEEVFPMSGADQAHEDFLNSLLLKTDAYRPLQTSLRCMEDPGFLDMRAAVVNWFAKVAVSYDFANETVVAALSHFDRYVSLTVAPVSDHMLLQLAAYVALLIASKMSEISPLRMKSLANLTGRMFTPLQVKRLEMDMISKLNFRLAPPSADETFHCLSSLLHNNGSGNRYHSDILAAGSYYLKKARARTCWFRHSPYTLAVAALAATYNSMGLGKLRRRLLRECDARARAVTGRGVDIHGAVKSGWGSPTGVAQGAELLQKAAFSAAAGRAGEGFSPCGAVQTKASSHVVAGRRAIRRVSSSSSSASSSSRVAAQISQGPMSPRDIRAPSPARGSTAPARRVSVSTSPLDVERTASPVRVSASQASEPRRHSEGGGQKRRLNQTSGSCFVPCSRRRLSEGKVCRRVDEGTSGTTSGVE